MKDGIHPTDGPVVFRDRSGDLLLLTRSTPTEGRAEAFRRRHGRGA